MRRTDWGVGIAVGLILVVIAAIYFYRTSSAHKDLVAFERFDAAPIAERPAASTVTNRAAPPSRPSARSGSLADASGRRGSRPTRGAPAPVMTDPPKPAPSSPPPAPATAKSPVATRPASPSTDAVQAARPPGESQPPASPPATPTGRPAEPGRIFAPPSGPPLVHTVEEGETLSEIAQRYYNDATAWKAIQQANPQIKSSTHLSLGMKLQIPARPEAASHPSRGRTTHEPATRPAPRAVATTQAAAGQYRVKSGDTLIMIAQRELGSGKRWKEIYELNKKLIGEDPTRLRAGTTIQLPPRGAASQPKA